MADRTITDIYTFDDTTGTVSAKDTATIQSLVSDDLKEVFGIEGDIEASTPLGRFVEWFTLAFSNVLRINVQNSNQFLLSAAAGQQLDALALAHGLERTTDADGEEETDESLRERINAAREVGVGFLSALKIAIGNVSGVTSSMVVENNTNESLTVSGIDEMDAHSIFVCVDYSTDVNADAESEIADAIFQNRPCGVGYTHITSSDYEVEKDVEDAFGNSYKVYFNKPEDKTVRLNIQVRSRSYSGTDLEGDVRTAVRTWFANHKFGVGETVYATDIEDGIEALVPGAVVVMLLVSDAGVDESSFKGATMLEIPANRKAVASSDDNDILVEVI